MIQTNQQFKEVKDRQGPKTSTAEGIPWLRFENPTPEQCRTHVDNLKIFVSRNIVHSWISTDPSKGIQRMLMIFPDPDGKAGTYPTANPVTLPSATILADATKEKFALARWKKDDDANEKQLEHIRNQKTALAGTIKQSLNDKIKACMRKEARGISALDSNDDPLDLINVFLSTDFTTNSQFHNNPERKFNVHLDRLQSKEFKMDNHDTLDTWHLKFTSEIAQLSLYAKASGNIADIPSEKRQAHLFYEKLNSRYDEMRRRIIMKLDMSIPDKVEDWMIKASLYQDNPLSSNDFNPSGKTKPVFTMVQDGGSKERFSCRHHKTHDHSFKDDVCNALYLKEQAAKGPKGSATSTKSESKNSNNKGGRKTKSS